MKRAFTLIEVLVSIAIFLIILGVVIVDYGKSQKINEFRLITFDIEDSINFTKNLSLTGQKINNTIPDNGYGIILNYNNNNSYIIYGDNGRVGYLEGDPLKQDLISSQNNLGQYVSFVNFICKIKDGSDIGYYEQNFTQLDINFSMPRGTMSIIIDGNQNIDVLSCQAHLSSLKAQGKWIINIIPGSSRIWTEFQQT